MTNNYTRYIHIKHAIEAVFGGGAWYELKETTNPKVWRKWAAKLLNAYTVVQTASITIVDDDWVREFDDNIQQGLASIKSAKTIDEVVDALSATLVRQSFLQFGMTLNRGGGSTIAPLRKDDWKLDRYRSVQYVQTKQQKDDLFYRDLQRQTNPKTSMDAKQAYLASKTDLSFKDWYSQQSE